MWLDHVVAQSVRILYWNVNYFGVLRAIAMAGAVDDHRDHASRASCMQAIYPRSPTASGVCMYCLYTAFSPA